MKVSQLDVAEDENSALIRRFQAGDRAAGDLLLRRNDGLVWTVVRWYSGASLQDVDLAQCGRIGLLEAIRRFDLTRGFKLSTYAFWWIQFEIRRELENLGDAIRIPVHVRTALRRESRSETGVVTPKLAEAEQLIRIESLDEPVWDGDRLLIEMLADPTDSQEQTLGDLEQARHLAHLATRSLSSREMDVLRRRYLADDLETLDQIGRSYRLSRERIRQIEVTALEKLRRALSRGEPSSPPADPPPPPTRA